MQLTVREVTKIFNASENKVYRWIKEEGMPALRIHGQYRFNRADLLEWATSRQIPFSQGILHAPDEDTALPPSLAQALEAGGIFDHVKGIDKEAVLRSIVDLLRLPESVDRALLLSVLLARESLGSTGIGEGIAIPHARNPIVLKVPDPMVSLCYLEKPVEFGSLDGKPVSILFALVSPTIRAHLSLLSQIAFVLHQPDFKRMILQKKSTEEILAAARQIESHRVRSVNPVRPLGKG